jgi:hypothetical protein
MDRRFEAVVSHWDGTAVPDRRADASDVRDVIERLCAARMGVPVLLLPVEAGQTRASGSPAARTGTPSN